MFEVLAVSSVTKTRAMWGVKATLHHRREGRQGFFVSTVADTRLSSTAFPRTNKYYSSGLKSTTKIQVKEGFYSQFFV